MPAVVEQASGEPSQSAAAGRARQSPSQPLLTNVTQMHCQTKIRNTIIGQDDGQIWTRAYEKRLGKEQSGLESSREGQNVSLSTLPSKTEESWGSYHYDDPSPQAGAFLAYHSRVMPR